MAEKGPKKADNKRAAAHAADTEGHAARGPKKDAPKKDAPKKDAPKR